MARCATLSRYEPAVASPRLSMHCHSHVEEPAAWAATLHWRQINGSEIFRRLERHDTPVDCKRSACRYLSRAATEHAMPMELWSPAPLLLASRISHCRLAADGIGDEERGNEDTAASCWSIVGGCIALAAISPIVSPISGYAAEMSAWDWAAGSTHICTVYAKHELLLTLARRSGLCVYASAMSDCISRYHHPDIMPR
jgi:hypothetical protein